jgi:hypothetical protein
MSELAQATESLDLSGTVAALGLGLARAQHALDLVALQTAVLLAEQRITFLGEQLSLLELGFAPTFYQFAETTLEARVAVTITREQAQDLSSSSRSADAEARLGLGLHGLTVGATAKVSSVDARFASRYGYRAESAAVLSTRLLPLPPPAELMRLLRDPVPESNYDH